MNLSRDYPPHLWRRWIHPADSLGATPMGVGTAVVGSEQ